MYNFIIDKLCAIDSATLQGTRPTHKNRLCFYKSKEQAGKEIKKTIPFKIAPEEKEKKIAPERRSHLGKTSRKKRKEVKDLPTKNYEILLNETKDLI